jgi:hypothetical protein
LPQNLDKLPLRAVEYGLHAVNATHHRFSVGCFADFGGARQMGDVAVLIDRVFNLVLIESIVAAFCDPRYPVIDGEDMRPPTGRLFPWRRG